ncbi:MAG: PIN domain-containing protein [Patescibacteria group bacterium]|jgi:predicted nucleic acid-binding protein
MAVSNDRYFADANYFVALFNPTDASHAAALEVAEDVNNRDIHLVISSFIFTEIVTVLSLRAGRKVGIEAGRCLLNDNNIENIHIDKFLQEQSWEIFQATEHKNISFIDCSSVAIMQTENISTALTFDTTDFKKLQKQYRFSLYPIV